jgi:hypothetical protein
MIAKFRSKVHGLKSMRLLQSFKHIFPIGLLLPAILAGSNSLADRSTVDLLEDGSRAWVSVDADWKFDNDEIAGASRIMDGAITDPAASTFLVSKQVFGGDIVVSLDVTFDEGRYLGVYVDFDQDTQTGIWMATGHALTGDSADNEVERAYIKTVENSFWIVRATGELVVQPGALLRLRFVRKGYYYSIFSDDTLIVTYYKSGGYPAGPLQIRLTNASARIHRLRVESDWID